VTDITTVGALIGYVVSKTEQERGREPNMKKIWTVAALLAVATIPLILANSTSAKRKPVVPVAGDANDIFEWELKEQ
jgi:hypothetical protein